MASRMQTACTQGLDETSRYTRLAKAGDLGNFYRGVINGVVLVPVSQKQQSSKIYTQ